MANRYCLVTTNRLLKSDRSLSLSRWHCLCRQFGIDDQAAIELEFKRIAAAYAEAHRAYHTAQHINECLNLLDWAIEHRSMPPQWSLVLEMALWYHDVVYHPQGFDNERQSADQAILFLQTHGREVAQINWVDSLIMATCHFAESQPGGMAELTNLMVDIDLAILGASAQRFLHYNHQIRQEYAWMPETVYRAKRQALLTEFLDRSVLYRSSIFCQRFECQSRENLAAWVSA